MLTHAAWPPIARTGYRYRHGKAPRHADIGELLSKLGTRHSMRDESLAAMELLRRLASRSSSAPPQSHADVCLISRVTALEEVVKSLAVASKDASGLISDHEIAILQLEMDIESIVRQPEAEVKVEPTDDVNLRFRENQPAGENPGVHADFFTELNHRLAATPLSFGPKAEPELEPEGVSLSTVGLLANVRKMVHPSGAVAGSDEARTAAKQRIRAAEDAATKIAA